MGCGADCKSAAGRQPGTGPGKQVRQRGGLPSPYDAVSKSLRHERVGDAGRQSIERDDFVKRSIAHDAGHQGGVHGMSRALGDDVAEEGTAQQGEVADEIQRLVAAALVRGAQSTGIHRALAGETDGVFQAGAANQAHVAHLVEIVLPAERAREGQFRGIALRGDFEFERLAAHRIGIIRIAGQAENFVGNDADALALVLHRDGTAYAQIAALAAILADAGLLDEAHEGEAAAVEDGHFQVIDLHVDVVDAHGVEDAQEVLGGGDEDALTHQAGGIADARHMAPTGGDWEAVEIGTYENHAGGDRGGEDANDHGHARVQAYSGDLYRALHRGLKTQSVPRASDLLLQQARNVTTSI